jgi:ketosteroid isomerase-like protein
MLEENVESIRRAYERWNRRDFGWATLAAPGFEYEAGGAPGLSGRFRGLEGFIGFLEQFWEEFDEAHVEPEELIDAGDSVLAVITFRGRGKQSGVEVNMEVFQLWTFRDGKVIRGQGFFDRKDALEPPGCRSSCLERQAAVRESLAGVPLNSP